MSEHDFRTDIKLDRFNLEMESEKQASLYQYWSEQLANAKHERDRMENRLKVRSAEVELDIRRSPPTDVKITESVVTALVQTNVELEALRAQLHEQHKEVAILDGAVRAFEQKKSMIEIQTRLWAAGYYSNPRHTDDAAALQRRQLNRRPEEN